MTVKDIYYSRVPKDAGYNFMVNLISYIFEGLGNGLLIPYFLLVARKELHANSSLIGLMTAAAGVGLILSFITTGLVKQNKELPCYIWMNIIGRVAIIFLIFAFNAPIFAFLMFIEEMTKSLPTPQYGIIIQKIFPSDCRATLISYGKIVLTLCTLLTTFLGGILIDKIGWHTVFFISGILYLISSVVMFWFKIPNSEVKTNNIPIKEYLFYGIKLFKKDKLNKNIIIGAFIVVLGVQIATILFPMTQGDIINLTQTQNGWLNSIYTVIWVGTFAVIGPFIDKKGSIRGLNLSFLLFMFIPLSYIFAHSWQGLIAAFVIMGLYRGTNDIAYFNMCIDLCPKGEEHIYQGVNSLWCGIRSFVNVFFATLVINKVMNISALTIEQKHSLLYIFASCVIIIGILYIHFTCRKQYAVKRN